MTTEIKKISEEFSKGKFPATYDHFADDIEWKIIGDQIISGKENAIAFCNKMMAEMDGSTLNNINVIVENNYAAIEGNCKFTNEVGKAATVEYCDVYRFEDGKIKTITSYLVSSETK
jgi:ketosteroid isomerase-like protein